MAYSQISAVIGQVQQGFINSVDITQREILGTTLSTVDNFWGYGEFKYVQFPASTPIPFGSVVVWTGFGAGLGYITSIAPVTANSGRSLAVAINSVASLPVVQYGWVQIAGPAVIKAVASVATGAPFGLDVTVPGSVNAATAGRQVLNAAALAPSTFAVVKTATITNGSPIITVSDTAGWVPGLTVTGTGVSGTILALDFDNRRITLSANSTAGGNSVVTATYTGFIVATLNRSFAQGQIV